MITVGTDCSGVEAPIVALRELGIDFKHVFSSEINPKLVNFILREYKPDIIYDNIIERDHTQVPYVDLYVAGFPCPSFSSASRYREGFKSDRGSLFFHCFNTIKNVRPKYFILENVKGILTHQKGETFKLIKQYLESLGDYNMYYEQINSKYFTPQDRTRIYIIGIHNSVAKQNYDFSFNNSVSHIKNIINFQDTSISSLSSIKKNLLNEVIKKHNIADSNDYWIINLNTSCVNFATARKNLSPTLLTSCQMYYITKLKRYLNLSELKKLQGLDNLDLSSFGKIDQIQALGNSMTVPVLKFILHKIIN